MAVYTAQLELANAECEAGIRPAFARRASARHGLLFGLLMRQQILAFAAITIPLVITPGIATTLVLRTSLLHGVAAGLVIAGGAALASASYGVLSGLSTTLVVERWPGALLVLEFGGSAFLVWLEGHAIWRALGPEDAVPRMAACGGVGQGFLANALNPPVALFLFPRGSPVRSRRRAAVPLGDDPDDGACRVGIHVARELRRRGRSVFAISLVANRAPRDRSGHRPGPDRLRDQHAALTEMAGARARNRSALPHQRD